VAVLAAANLAVVGIAVTYALPAGHPTGHDRITLTAAQFGEGQSGTLGNSDTEESPDGFYQANLYDNWLTGVQGLDAYVSLTGSSSAQSEVPADTATLTDTWVADGLALDNCSIGLPPSASCQISGSAATATWSTTVHDQATTSHHWSNLRIDGTEISDVREQVQATFDFSGNSYQATTSAYTDFS
jgi:hypothetical protein